jgi:hypothetical protein
MNSLNHLPYYFLKIHAKTTRTFNPSKWFLNFTFPHQNSACISLLSHTCQMPCPYLLSSADHQAPHRVVSPSLSLPLSFPITLFSVSFQASRDTATTEVRTRTAAMQRIVVDQLLASLYWLSYVDACTLDVNLRIQIPEEMGVTASQTICKHAGWQTEDVRL